MTIPNSPKRRYPVAADEVERINKLKKHQVLNNNDEPAFGRLTELAKLFFDMPVVTITFMDEETQYLKSVHGLGGVCTTTRQVAICNYTVLSDEVFVVADLTKDSRFSQNPLVTESPYLRFYAGAPIIMYEDNKTYRLGSFGLMDMKPHDDFDNKQAQLLGQFGMMCGDALKLPEQQRVGKHCHENESDLLGHIGHEIRQR